MLLSVILTIFMLQAAIIYVNENLSFFNALERTFLLLKKDFWEKFGATVAMYFIAQGLTIGLIIVFGGIGFCLIYFLGGVFSIGLTGILGIAGMLFLFAFSNLTVFLQMIIYYSSKHDEKKLSEIEQIGRLND